MEGDIINLNPTPWAPIVRRTRLRLVVQEQFVVEAEFALGCAGEIAFDLDAAGDVVVEDGALVRYLYEHRSGARQRECGKGIECSVHTRRRAVR